MKYLEETDFSESAEIVQGMTVAQLDDLELAIKQQRLAKMVTWLTNAGFVANWQFRDEIAYSMIQVCAPDENSDPWAVWATIAECRRLLDIEANIKNPQKSFERWHPTIEETSTPSDREFVSGQIEADCLASAKKFASTYDNDMAKTLREVAREIKRARTEANPRGAGRRSKGQRRTATLTGLSDRAAEHLDSQPNKAEYLVRLVDRVRA
jgi:hypothetical protein